MGEKKVMTIIEAAKELGISKGSAYEAARTGKIPTIRIGRPLYLRPFLYFIYRYFILLGFLDGKQGFVFHFLQAFWFRLLVDINIDEMRETGKIRD